MKTALVTGSAGFVGRHLTAALVEHGWQVTEVDVRAGQDCRPLFDGADHRFELIVHCAAVVGGRAVIEGAPLATATNLALDSDMFRYAVRTNTPRVVYFSSSAVYPVDFQVEGIGHRLRESDVDLDRPRMPDAVYGWAKLTGELLARHTRERGVRVHVFRPFSGYGADQSIAYPFPSFIERAVNREDPFEVWGSGRQVRDWVHIDDVVETVFAALDADDEGPLNIGWGVPVTFLDLARRVCSAAGYEPEIRTLSGAPVGVHHRVADPTRLRALRPPTTVLDAGIEQALMVARAAAVLP